VSHDREFLDGLVTCVYEFRNKKIKQHLGGIYDFLEKKKMESLKELEIKSNSKKEEKNSSQKSLQEEISFKDQKEINKNISRIEKLVEKTEEEIGQLETEIAKLDKILSSSATIDDHSIFGKYEELKEKLKAVVENWEAQHIELEDWKSKKNW
jgi:ATP-binding cassette subfamily F protein 3